MLGRWTNARAGEMLGWLRPASGAGAGDGYDSSAVFLGAGIVIIQSLDKTFRHFAISHQIYSKKTTF